MESFRSLVLPTFALLVLALSLAQGVVIHTNKCRQSAERAAACTVHEVRVTPCNPGGRGVDCQIPLGTQAQLEFDYTPTWSAEKVGTMASKVGVVADIPFALMDSDGCKTTKCPVDAAKKQTYKYDLNIGNNSTQFPAMIHELKWRLWNEEDHHQQCCFMFQLQLV